MARELLYQSDRLRVVLSEAGSEAVVVTFDEGRGAAGDLDFRAADLLESMGVTAIGFVSLQPNWYPLLYALAAGDAARARIGSRRVLTYGFSHGGYGALKFSASLAAETVLAFSPQWSINPADTSGFDDRFTGWFDPALRNGERIEADELGGRTLVFYDTAVAPDRGHADRLGRIGQVQPVTLPFAGHNTAGLFTAGGMERALIELCLTSHKASVADIRRLARPGRATSISYTLAKLQRLRGSIGRHPGFLAAATAALPDGAARTLAVAQNKLAAGDPAAAEQLIATVPDGELAALDLPSLQTAFQAAGFTAGEARIAPLFRAGHPDDLWRRLMGVGSMLAAGMPEPALQELQAIAAMPGAAAHVGKISALFGQLDHAELATAFTQALADREVAARPERIRVAFEIAAALNARNLRGPLFRELRTLSALCAGNLPLTLQLADIYFNIGEISFARVVLDQLPPDAAAAPAARLYRLQTEKVLDENELVGKLRALAKEGSTDPAFWQRLSYVAEFNHDQDLAIEAARKAIATTEGEQAWGRFRLAQTLTAAGQRRAALSELEALLDSDLAVKFEGRNMASFAIQCGRPALALSVVQRWLAIDPDSANAQIMHCVCQRAAEDAGALRSAAAVVLQRVQGGLALNREQFRSVIDSVRGVDHALETGLAEAAGRQHPAEEEFQGMAKPSAFAAKFFAADPPHKPAGKTGLLGRLGFRRP